LDEKVYLDRLLAQRMELSDGACQRGAGEGDPGYTYGIAVGVNHGLRIAEQLLMNLLKEEKETDE
jgi:hypothetical protein